VLKGPKQQRNVPRPVAPDDVLALADEAEAAASEPWIGARDLAVLLLLYGAGLRVSEALGLTGAVLPLGDVLSVTGKRAKTRIVPLLPQVRAAITRYVELSPYGASRDEPLFRGARGGPLNGEMVRRAVRHARRSMGLGERTTPHALRHSFATHLLGAARTCALCRSCSATPASPRPRSIPPSTPPTCSTSTARLTPAPDPRLRGACAAVSTSPAATRKRSRSRR
jgi:site-specific recombinase XerC